MLELFSCVAISRARVRTPGIGQGSKNEKSKKPREPLGAQRRRTAKTVDRSSERLYRLGCCLG